MYFYSYHPFADEFNTNRSGGYGSTAYVTFKEPYALETAVLLSVSFIGRNIFQTSGLDHFFVTMS